MEKVEVTRYFPINLIILYSNNSESQIKLKCRLFLTNGDNYLRTDFPHNHGDIEPTLRIVLRVSFIKLMICFKMQFFCELELRE